MESEGKLRVRVRSWALLSSDLSMRCLSVINPLVFWRVWLLGLQSAAAFRRQWVGREEFVPKKGFPELRIVCVEKRGSRMSSNLCRRLFRGVVGVGRRLGCCLSRSGGWTLLGWTLKATDLWRESQSRRRSESVRGQVGR